MKSSLLVPLLFLLIQLLSLPLGHEKRLPVKENLENCEEIRADNADDCLRMNHIQLLGTHNSYHVKPPARLVSLLDDYEKGWAENIDYSHRPLQEQLEELGIRQFEIDIFPDPEGGHYAQPSGAILSEDSDYPGHPELMKPGLKVIHGTDVDYRTTCLTFISCLTEIRDWSLQNRTHLPIMVLVELKGGGEREGRGPVSFTTPVNFNRELILDIDREIRMVFEEEHLLTPAEVQGDSRSLEEAILTKGWPTLSESRGRILFALDNTNELREIYQEALKMDEGRILFTSFDPGEADAGFIKMNDSIGGIDQIRERSKAGYLIRTRADIPVREAKSGDTTRREAALNSGAHYISTDYPEMSPFGSGYIVRLPDAKGPGRCNPVTAPPTCKNQFIVE